MNISFSDPIVLICLGVLLMGFVFLVWAIGRLRQPRPSSPLEDLLIPDSAVPSESPSIPNFEFTKEPISVPAGKPFAAASAGSSRDSKEIGDRLEAMTLKLTEMQSVLSKQAPVIAGAAPSAAGIGQGFSPETIDKLLHIIGNVIAQVEVLQRSVGKPAAGGAPRAAAPPTTASAMAAASGGVIFPPSKTNPPGGASGPNVMPPLK